jgi:hypothetical protein
MLTRRLRETEQQIEELQAGLTNPRFRQRTPARAQRLTRRQPAANHRVKARLVELLELRAAHG